jgi:hypothetical protein
MALRSLAEPVPKTAPSSSDDSSDNAPGIRGFPHPFGGFVPYPPA